MKIIVTGGAGYIGSHTIVELIESKGPFDIISIDNFSNSSPETFDRIERITGRKIKNYPIDLCDFEKTVKVFSENPDTSGVIHFAAYKAVGESVENPLMYYSNNLNSLINVLKCCKSFNTNQFIFSSSCTVYGNNENFPIAENSALGKTTSPYGETKAVGERIIQDFVNSQPGFCAILLRYFNPVGAHLSGLIGEDPRNKPNNLVPVITQTAIGLLEEMTVFGTDYNTRDGSCVRDYVHVMDIANAHYKALNYIPEMKKRGLSIDFFNLGTGKGVTVLEAINAFLKMPDTRLNYKIGERRNGDLPVTYADTKKAAEILKWNTKYTIDEMMKSAWKWQINK